MIYKMKHLKTFEDACATGTTSGMGAVSSSQPGSTPGTFGTTGSGDVGSPLLPIQSKIPANIKKKPKKGNARQVSDMRFLGPDKIGDIFSIQHTKD